MSGWLRNTDTAKINAQRARCARNHPLPGKVDRSQDKKKQSKLRRYDGNDETGGKVDIDCTACKTFAAALSVGQPNAYP